MVLHHQISHWYENSSECPEFSQDFSSISTLKYSQSHYRGVPWWVGDFYGTGIEIWAGFGPVGITEKKIGLIMSNF